MTRTTQKALRTMIREHVAEELTSANIPANYEKVQYSMGAYGMNGGLIRCTDTGKLFVIPSRSTLLFMIF
jgi:hypothetical protein